MIDALLMLVLGFVLIKFILPAFSAFTAVFREELKRIDREGLIQTNGNFWSPDQEKLNPKHH